MYYRGGQHPLKNAYREHWNLGVILKGILLHRARITALVTLPRDSERKHESLDGVYRYADSSIVGMSKSKNFGCWLPPNLRSTIPEGKRAYSLALAVGSHLTLGPPSLRESGRTH